MAPRTDQVLDHALPAELVDVLDATARFLARLAQAELLPSPWHAELTVQHDRMRAMMARHVWRGEA